MEGEEKRHISLRKIPAVICVFFFPYHLPDVMMMMTVKFVKPGKLKIRCHQVHQVKDKNVSAKKLWSDTPFVSFGYLLVVDGIECQRHLSLRFALENLKMRSEECVMREMREMRERKTWERERWKGNQIQSEMLVSDIIVFQHRVYLFIVMSVSLFLMLPSSLTWATKINRMCGTRKTLWDPGE